MYPFRLSALVLGALSAALFSVPQAAQTTPEVRDAWSDLITLRAGDGWYSAPVHATLMPDGTAVFIGYERDVENPMGYTYSARKAAFTIQPSPIWQPVDAELVVGSLIEPVDANFVYVPPMYVDDTLFCAGNTLTADGRMFTVGGTRNVLDVVSGASYAFGLSYATLFDGTTWTRVQQDMQVAGALGTPARWYPSVVRLPDERLFVVSGLDIVQPVQTQNLSAEIFDPATGQWDVLSDLGEVPYQVYNGDYTHPFVLPNPVRTHDLLMFGHEGIPVLCSTSREEWSLPGDARPGALPFELPNHGTSTTMLPLRHDDGEWGYANGAVMLAGGAHNTTHMRHLDVYDPVANDWRERVDAEVMRHHPSTVLLPDGRLLVVAGHNKLGSPELRHTTYVNPRDGFDVRLGLSPTDEVRGYHNVALLLPDGRVLVAGGQDLVTGDEAEKASLRYYYPSYLFARLRPVILTAPETLRYGESFALRTAGLPVSEVVLISLGSMTHSFDANQRSVELEIQSHYGSIAFGAGAVFSVGAPEDANIAPPGHYMLFALDARRIPSEARIVRLE